MRPRASEDKISYLRRLRAKNRSVHGKLAWLKFMFQVCRRNNGCTDYIAFNFLMVHSLCGSLVIVEDHVPVLSVSE